MRFMRLSRIPAAALVAGVSVVAGVYGGALVAQTPSDRATARLTMFTMALSAIEHEYVEPLEKTCPTPTPCGVDALVYGSIDGMLHTLDPHSSFFSPNDFAAMRERQNGRYYGIGIS